MFKIKKLIIIFFLSSFTEGAAQIVYVNVAVKLVQILGFCLILSSHQALKSTLIDEKKTFFFCFQLYVESLSASFTATGLPCFVLFMNELENERKLSIVIGSLGRD